MKKCAGFFEPGYRPPKIEPFHRGSSSHASSRGASGGSRSNDEYLKILNPKEFAKRKASRPDDDLSFLSALERSEEEHENVTTHFSKRPKTSSKMSFADLKEKISLDLATDDPDKQKEIDPEIDYWIKSGTSASNSSDSRKFNEASDAYFHEMKASNANFKIDESDYAFGSEDIAKPKKSIPSIQQFIAASLSSTNTKDQNSRKDPSFPTLDIIWSNYVRRNKEEEALSDAMVKVSVDSMYRNLLYGVNLAALIAEEEAVDPSTELTKVPNRFLDEQQYIRVFEPLLLEEVKTALSATMSGGNGEQTARRDQRCADSQQPLSIPLEYVEAREQEPNSSQELSVLIELVVAESDGFGSSRRSSFQKEDLILVSNKGASVPVAEMIRSSQCWLAVVADVLENGREWTRCTSKSEARDEVKYVLLTTTDCKRHCQGSKAFGSFVMSLATFVREWAALHSIRSDQLLPLAPYILKAAPVVSASKLSFIGEFLTSKFTSLQRLQESRGSQRWKEAQRSLFSSLQELSLMHIDGSVLLKSKIVDVLRHIKSSGAGVDLSSKSTELITTLLKTWKQQVKDDNRQSTIRNLKCGQLVPIPSAEKLHETPPGVPVPLWRALCGKFNLGQLLAVKFVSDQMDTTQDTKISLVQGPPGTGKTSTILGMISVLLHRMPTGSFTSHSADAAAPLTVDDQKLLTRTISYNCNRLLICAPSNAAVDEILRRLLGGVLNEKAAMRQVRLIRLGDPLPGADPMVAQLSLEFQTERRLESSSLFVDLQETSRQIKELADQLKKKDESTKPCDAVPVERKPGVQRQLFELRKQRSVLYKAVEAHRHEIRRNLLNSAEIVAGTLSSSGKQVFLDHILRDNVRFDTAIVDEAAQASEPATLIPLRYGCKRLVLVGDPRQLPATILSPRAEGAGLSQSLFERLEKSGHEVVMLTTQYRMHPEIRSFPSMRFYNDKLVDAEEIVKEVVDFETRGTLPQSSLVCATYISPQHALEGGNNNISSDMVVRGRTLRLRPFTFFDVSNTVEERIGKSLRNIGEIQFLEEFLARFLPMVPLDHTIGIISPYKAQVAALKRSKFFSEMQQTSPTSNERLSRNSSESSDAGTTDSSTSPTPESCRVEINTVDGFQGREKDIICISCVRTSSRGNIGFVADERRVNVAVTRARRALVVVGNSRTLSRDDSWKTMLEHAQSKNCVYVM